MPKGPKLLSLIFTVTGVAHFGVPHVFDAIIPSWVPVKRPVTYLSGAAELGCAFGLRAGRRWAGPASAVLLLGVWPANIQMAVDAAGDGKPWWYQAGLWVRVPMQLPLIWLAIGDRSKVFRARVFRARVFRARVS